jgi:hypothetical protein
LATEARSIAAKHRILRENSQRSQRLRVSLSSNSNGFPDASALPPLPETPDDPSFFRLDRGDGLLRISAMILPPWLWRLVHSRKFWGMLIGTPVLGLVLFYAIANAWGARKLEQTRKELSAKGYALTWKEVMKSGVAPEDDLLRHEVMAEKPYDLEAELMAKGYDSTRLGKWIPIPSVGIRFSAATVCGLPASEEANAIHRLTADLVSMEPTASEIKAAVRASKGIGWTVSGRPPCPKDPSLPAVSWMNRFLLRRAVLRAASGETGEAMDDLRVNAEYLKLLRSEPRTMLSTVIGLGVTAIVANAAWHIAQAHSMNPAEIHEISQMLNALDIGQHCVDCHRIEIVSTNDLISPMFGTFTALAWDETDLVFSWMDVRKWGPEINSCWWQLRPVGFFKSELADALLRIDRNLLQFPNGDPRQSWTHNDANTFVAIKNAIPEFTGLLGFNHGFFDSSYYALPELIRKNLKVRTWLRLCRTGIAAELYRREHGCLPASIDDLVPAYLPAVPLDAFSETPIRMETTPDGIITFVTKGIGKDTELRLPVSPR